MNLGRKAVLIVVVAVVVINDDCAGAVKEAQPRINGRGMI
jgi:hypothetical protein